jgi:ABC-type molybdate transport system substrate-binding protein
MKMPVIPSDRADDLHGLVHADSADLVLFMAGNQFMAMPELLDAFRSEYPDVPHIFYETLPPGLELRQILAGGAIFRNGTLTGFPDIYTSVSASAMDRLAEAGRVTPDAVRPYLRNRITLMVPPGNPGGIVRVSDLGREGVRISQPDPANEDIGHHILEMYRRAGGQGLVHRVMEEKRADGTTILTVVHHRETPLRIRKQTVDAGPVWATEAVHARATGLAFETVEPGPELDGRDRVRYYAAALRDAPNPENAARFLDFLTTSTAAAVFERHGFLAERRRRR